MMPSKEQQRTAVWRVCSQPGRPPQGGPFCPVLGHFLLQLPGLCPRVPLSQGPSHPSKTQGRKQVNKPRSEASSCPSQHELLARSQTAAPFLTEPRGAPPPRSAPRCAGPPHGPSCMCTSRGLGGGLNSQTALLGLLQISWPENRGPWMKPKSWRGQSSPSLGGRQLSSGLGTCPGALPGFGPHLWGRAGGREERRLEISTKLCSSSRPSPEPGQGRGGVGEHVPRSQGCWTHTPSSQHPQEGRGSQLGSCGMDTSTKLPGRPDPKPLTLAHGLCVCLGVDGGPQGASKPGTRPP